MKSKLILWLTVGLLGASGVPMEEEFDSRDITPVSSELNDSQAVIKTILNKGETEQSARAEENTNIDTLNQNIAKITDADIVIEEEFDDNPLNVDYVPEPHSAFYLGDAPEVSALDANNLFRNAIPIENEDEMMDHAASGIFAGYAILQRSRKKQNARRRVATRRRYLNRRTDPYRAFRHYYPYYGYHRPSSLRFYY